jgi:NAD(P)-dependent dehydrogenase (short-subunit alcohol dehydrogenase family)
MAGLLQDEVAVVTGGASGNGRAIAMALAREGAHVVVADLQAEPREGGTPTHELVTAETDSKAKFVRCDVTTVADVEAAVEEADEFGGVDVMVNNAGIFRAEEFLEVTEEEYDRLMDVNVKGVFFGAQAAAKKMREKSGGSIVNISSVAGLRGSGPYVTYNTSKGAVKLMTYALASKLGPEGIRVNAVHPGLIETTMTTEDVPIFGTDQEDAFVETIPSRRSGTPEDVANAVLFLASDLADYVNGESLVVDGGMANTL